MFVLAGNRRTTCSDVLPQHHTRRGGMGPVGQIDVSQIASNYTKSDDTPTVRQR